MSRRSSHKCDKKHLSPEAGFYKSLRAYIMTLLILFAAGVILSHGFFNVFRIVAFWWGIALAIKLVKFRGLPGTKGWLSDDWFDWINRRYPSEPIEPINNHKKPTPGEDYDPLWKDKDMV